MNVLVVGGAGYVGSHQTKKLCDLNYNVVVVDNLNTGFEKMIDKRAKFYKGDIRNLQFIESVLKDEKIEAVFHFAALSLVGESVEQPLEYYDNNVYGMQVLLTAMKNTGVDKIIFSSTAATYGNHEVMPIDEEYSTNPTNPYGETKLAMEKMIKWAHMAYGIKYVALRYFNVAGASFDSTLGELHNPETHLIPIVLQVALGQRDAIKIFGDDYNTPDGTCIRDYIHVEDLVNAHIKALESIVADDNSDIYNLGYGHGFSVKEIIETSRKVTGHEIPAMIEPRRAGDPDQLIAKSKKAQEKLNWTPQYDDIEKIISSAYKFHENNIRGK